MKLIEHLAALDGLKALGVFLRNLGSAMGPQCDCGANGDPGLWHPRECPGYVTMARRMFGKDRR